jgi:hypothetical protein
VVTIYATLGEEGFLHGAIQTRAKLVVADAKLLKVLTNVIKTDGAKIKDLKKIVGGGHSHLGRRALTYLA